MTLKFLHLFYPTAIFQPTKVLNMAFDMQYIAYIVLAILCGIIGSVFISIINNLIFIRAKFKLPFISNRWLICLTIAIFVAACSYPIDFMRVPEKTVLQEMFSQKPLTEQEKNHWNDPSILINLVLYFFLKFLMIILAVSLPIPSGVFTPSLLLGAVFGRFFGYVLRLMFGVHIHETTYAIVGATCMTASVTRTLSVAMIVFEINGELSYLVPVLVGVIISYAISNSMGRSIFEILLDMKDLPYLPTIRAENMKLKAQDVMKTQFDYLRVNSPISDLNGLIGAKQRVIPVIKGNGLLVFAVDIQYLRKYLIEYYKSQKYLFSNENTKTLDNYFNYIKSINHEEEGDFYLFMKEKQFDSKSMIRRENILGRRNTYVSAESLEFQKKNEIDDGTLFTNRDMNKSFDEYDPDNSDDESLERFWSTPIGKL